MERAGSLAARAVVCAVVCVLGGCVAESGGSPAGPAEVLEPAPAPDEAPRIVGVENPQTERLPLLNPGGVDGTRGPR